MAEPREDAPLAQLRCVFDRGVLTACYVEVEPTHAVDAADAGRVLARLPISRVEVVADASSGVALTKVTLNGDWVRVEYPEDGRSATPQEAEGWGV